ncbi:MAG TPA: response regulator [Puia sp.]|nr:response regulator [Puia sp.]
MDPVKKILLVDDDADDQLYFRDALNEISPDSHCEIASNGKEALEQIGIPPPPDLIFLDLNMPVMNGYECLVALKQQQRYKDIPVVIFTTSKNALDVQRSKELGADLFLTKPADFGILCDKLLKILDLDFSNLPFYRFN